MVELDEKDLLQANATILAGVLILLAVTASIADSFKPFAKISMAFATGPFIVSILFLLVGKVGKYQFSARTKLVRSAKVMIIGLIYLLIAVILLLTFSE